MWGLTIVLVVVVIIPLVQVWAYYYVLVKIFKIIFRFTVQASIYWLLRYSYIVLLALPVLWLLVDASSFYDFLTEWYWVYK